MYREYERQQLNFVRYWNGKPFANQNEELRKDFIKIQAELWKYKHYQREIQKEVDRFLTK